MLERPLITRSFAQSLAVLHQTVPRAEIRNVMGPGLVEVRNVVAAQGIEITGPWLTHHLRMDPEVFDFEICLPVASPIVAAGRVKPGISHAAWVAQTVYQGGYEGLGVGVGRVHRVDGKRRAYRGGGFVGGLSRGSGSERRPGHVAHATHAGTGALVGG